MTRLARPSQALLALAVIVVAAAGVTRLRWAEGLRDRFLPDDPAVGNLEHEERLFGSAESVAILVETEAPFDPERIVPQLRVWRAHLARVPGVHSVTTILELPTVVWESPSRWRVRTVGEADDPIAVALRHPIARKTLVRADGRGMAIVIEMQAGSMTRLAERRALARELEQWIAHRPENYRFTLAGTLPFQMAALDATLHDVLVICPLLVLALLGLLAWAFRSPSCAFALTAVAALAVVAAFGTFGHLGRPVSQFNLIVAAVIFTVALLDSVHLAYAYCRARESDARDRAITHAVREVLAPCFWTSATAIAGFWALTFSSLPHVRQFGALAVVGIAWAFVTSFTLLPALLRLADPSGPVRLRMAVRRIGEIRRPWLVVSAAVVALALVAPGLWRIEVLPDFPRLFSDDHPITRQLARIEREWGGAATISYLVALPPDVDEIGPQRFERLTDFANLLAARELVTAVVSPLDLVLFAAAEYRRSFSSSLPRAELEGALRRLLSGDFSNAETEALRPWISADAGTVRIVARVRMSEPERFSALAADLEGLRSGLADLFDVRLSGWPLVFKNMEARLLGELYTSFLRAFAVVALELLVAFRSLRLWALSLVPTIPPVWLALGALGMRGEPLSSGLLLAPGIALGLIVDDTIHFLYALRRDPGSSADIAEVARSALDRVGVALLISSLVLFVGFAMLLLSEFRGYRLLGAVMMGIVVVAWLADVVLTPAVLALGERWGQRSAQPSPARGD